MLARRKKHRVRSHYQEYFEKKDERQLRYAASKNDCERLTQLLESGVNPNACDDNCRTALHLASATGYSDIVRILLSYNADCNVVDKLGNTPLHLAVCTTSTSTINLLLNAGCSAFQRGHNGYTPLQLAQTKFWLLEKYCGPAYSEVKTKVSQIIETMKMLMKDETQEKKLIELFSSELLLSDNSDLASDVNRILKNLNDLQL